MDEFLTWVADRIGARLDGPMAFRFIVQPLVMIAVGIRHGIGDAKAGRRPIVAGLLFDKRRRKERLGAVLKALRVPLVVGVVLDAVAQYLIFGQVNPVSALIVGALVITAPYATARGIANRIVSARR